MPRGKKASKAAAKKAEPKSKETVEQKVLAGLKKKFKSGTIRTLAKAHEEDKREAIPTTIDVLDHYILGWGGLLVGRCTELIGVPDAGKTSLVMRCLASAQMEGGLAVLIENEDTLVHERGATYGLDPERVILSEPVSMNDVVAELSEVLKLIPKGTGPNLIAWDSLAAAPMASIFEGKNPAGGKARLTSDYLPAITELLLPKRAHLLIVNQVRSAIGAFGDPTTSPGGGTPKYLASTRLQMWRGKNIEGAYDVSGHYVTIKSIKNKMWPAWRKTKLRLDYAKGWNNDWSLFSLAKDLDLIPSDTELSMDAIAEAKKLLSEHETWWRKQ